MNPAFSVILFTTLSGAGYGLLTSVGLLLLLSSSQDSMNANAVAIAGMAPLLVVCLLLGSGLTLIGLASSTFHLGKPLRAWRAFSQWQTSWLSREGILACATFIPALALAVVLSHLPEPDQAMGVSIAPLAWLSTAVVIACAATVYCTAMIYASLKPVPAWRHWLVAPTYLVFAMLTGLLVFCSVTLSWTSFMVDDPAQMTIPRIWVVILGAVVNCLTAIKLIYWRDIDRIVLPSPESATALEGIGKVTVFERPHTEANYLTREMGFVLARKHSRKLRVIALLLFAGIPLLALLAAILLPAVAVAALWAAALAAFAGAFVERWLFFAEAKHMVMLYY